MATKWPGELMSGNPIIDFQHRLVLQAIKKLMTQLRAGDGCTDAPGGDAFKEALIFFDCYCIEHFGDEEQILEEYQYPDLQNHKAEHEILINEINKIKIRYNKEGYSQELGYEYMATVSGWLKKHFDKADREIIQFLKKVTPPKTENKAEIKEVIPV
jgi:hemerythrin